LELPQGHILISKPIDISFGELSGSCPAGVGAKAVNRNNANKYCEKVAENGGFGGCFRHPFHHPRA
jgi:hypothetical protein